MSIRLYRSPKRSKARRLQVQNGSVQRRSMTASFRKIRPRTRRRKHRTGRSPPFNSRHSIGLRNLVWQWWAHEGCSALQLRRIPSSTIPGQKGDMRMTQTSDLDPGNLPIGERGATPSENESPAIDNHTTKDFREGSQIDDPRIRDPQNKELQNEGPYTEASQNEDRQNGDSGAKDLRRPPADSMRNIRPHPIRARHPHPIRTRNQLPCKCQGLITLIVMLPVPTSPMEVLLELLF